MAVSLTNDPGKEVRRQVVFRLLQREQRECGDTQLVVKKAFDLARDDLALKVENGRGQREVEERLLAVAQRVQAAFLAVGALVEDDRDFADDFFKPTTNEAEPRLGVDDIVMEVRPACL